MIAKKTPRTLQIAAPDEPRSIRDYDYQITTAMRAIAAQWIGTDGKATLNRERAHTGPSVYAGWHYAL